MILQEQRPDQTRVPPRPGTLNLPADDATRRRINSVFLCHGANWGVDATRLGISLERPRAPERRWAGYLLPKARAVTTCMQPNLVRHEICIALKLTFYYVTDYEYYITGPLTLSVKIEALLLGGGSGSGVGMQGERGGGEVMGGEREGRRRRGQKKRKEKIIQERQGW